MLARFHEEVHMFHQCHYCLSDMACAAPDVMCHDVIKFQLLNFKLHHMIVVVLVWLALYIVKEVFDNVNGL